ncbi:MAG TPA: FecR domain-containing protein, partial [Labilithrix sp.]|nr:FecR domain-containing protein [Labilithrix sp.]
MTKHSLAKLAMRALADAPLDVDDVSRRDADLAIAAIARELAEVRKRRQRRWTLALAAAAAVVLTVGMTWRRGSVEATASVDFVSGGVMLVHGDEGRKMTRGDGLAQGDRVVASAEGAATLRLRNGTELRAVRGADVLLAEQGRSQVFDLRAGTVNLHVAKLQAGERFVVRTGDAEVEVRGTEFTVEVGEACGGSTTRVAVREGIVVVRHAGVEARVTANESWPPACERPASAPSRSPLLPSQASVPPASVSASASVSPLMPSEAPPVPSEAPGPTAMAAVRPPVLLPASTNGAPRPAAAPSSAPGSELAEQNRLFADAMAAKRRGDVP